MPRDYKTRAASKNKKSLPGYVWLLSGLAIGLFVAFIIYLDKQPENDNNFGDAVQLELQKLKQQAKKNNDTPKKITKKKNQEEPKQEKKEPKFNFYTLLPELEVLIPEEETRPPETKNTRQTGSQTSKHSSTKSKRYTLQVGSFQNLNDAEKLKANLAFLGLAANIQHVTVNKQAWHRVKTGPYKNKKQLYKNQKLLKRNNITAIPMELK